MHFVKSWEHPAASELPRVGMLGHVRNRLAVIAAVEHSQPEQLHWVQVEYLDQDGPPQDQILWEREANARVWPPNRLPNLQQAKPHCLHGVEIGSGGRSAEGRDTFK